MPDRSRGGRLRVIGIGKAVAAMATGLARSIDIDEGLLIVKTPRPCPAACRIHVGDHPIPAARSLAAGQALRAFINERPPEQYAALDRYVVLLSGGASALCVEPLAGVSLEDKQRITEELLLGGAPIEEINRRRRALSALKGGGLALALLPAPFVTLALSDVRNDDPAVIGSAPTWLDEGEVHADVVRGSYAVVASLDDALAAAARESSALDQSDPVVVALGRVLDGDVSELAVSLGRQLRALQARSQREQRVFQLIAGGEPTVKVQGHGRGGRAQELALRLAVELAGLAGIRLLAAGTDGNDGPTDAAGGFADGESLARLHAAGIDPLACLADNDSYRALQRLGDLFFTSATETNVADILLARVDGRS
jgi:glycerate-2-kinase